jgi:hypothetical protein
MPASFQDYERCQGVVLLVAGRDNAELPGFPRSRPRNVRALNISVTELFHFEIDNA